MREDSGFGVVLIVAGQEAGGAAQTVEIGTLARIVDFEQLDDGLLGITARGERRFRIVHVHQESDGLNVCQVEWREDEVRAEVPPQHAVLAELLRRAIEQIGPAYGELTPAYEDATWVSMRLAEILPLAPIERQELLELNDGPERLQWLQTRLNIQEAARRARRQLTLVQPYATTIAANQTKRGPADHAVILADDEAERRVAVERRRVAQHEDRADTRRMQSDAARDGAGPQAHHREQHAERERAPGTSRRARAAARSARTAGSALRSRESTTLLPAAPAACRPGSAALRTAGSGRRSRRACWKFAPQL